MGASRRLWLAAAVALLVTAQPAAAGSADDPEVTDPAGDQEVGAGPLVVPGVNDDAFGDVDVVAAWVGPESGGAVTLTVQTAAPLTEGTGLNVTFDVARGPTSLHTSTASGARHAIVVEGLAASGVPGVQGQQQDDLYVLTVPLAAIGATGGDLLANLTASASRADAGDLPLTQDDQAAADRAPDAGGGASYTFARVPVRAGLELAAAGGRFTAHGGDAKPTLGSRVTVTAADGDVHFDLVVRNTGTDPDTVTFGVAAPTGAPAATVEPRRVDLLPGASAELEFDVTLHDAREGELTYTVSAASARGATASQALDFAVAFPSSPPPPGEREPTPAGLDFLTPWAEALHLDDALGEYAELFLLAILVLLAILLVFLLLALARRPWVKVEVEPRRVVASPGETVEVHVGVQNRRPGERHATARAGADDANWRTGILLERDAAGATDSPGRDEVEIVLPGRRDAASPVPATLKVQVPPTAGPKERHDVRLDVVPLDAGGAARPSHAGHATVRIETGPTRSPADRSPIRLDPVLHQPSRPAPGETVHSTVTLHNDGGRPERLRVVLSVDGTTEAEARVELPPKSDETVRLTWEAGAGPNQVRVQAFAA